MWETRFPMRGSLRYAPRDGSAPLVEVVAPRPEMLHRITLTGLTPDTAYRYEVRDAVERWHEGTFRTLGPADRPFTFLVYGDCRSSVDQHRSVVEAMLTEGADFVVNTGDFVEDGAKPRLWRHFFRVEQPLLRNVPMYPVLGNHELKTSFVRGTAAFRRHFAVPENGPERGVVYHFQWGNSFFLVLNSNVPMVGSPQVAWAEDELTRAAALPHIRHLFVFMHHGPWASGIHGENAEVLASGLPGVMSRLGVDVTFGGHDHVYERGEQAGLRYVVSGGCGAPLYPRRRVNDYTAWFESTPHFVRVTVEGDEVELTAMRPDGSVIDHLRYAKRAGGDGVGRGAPRFEVLRDAHPRPMPPPAPETLLGEAPVVEAASSPGPAGVILLAAICVTLGLFVLLIGRRIRR